MGLLSALCVAEPPSACSAEPPSACSAEPLGLRLSYRNPVPGHLLGSCWWGVGRGRTGSSPLSLWLRGTSFLFTRLSFFLGFQACLLSLKDM